MSYKNHIMIEMPLLTHKSSASYFGFSTIRDWSIIWHNNVNFAGTCAHLVFRNWVGSPSNDFMLTRKPTSCPVDWLIVTPARSEVAQQCLDDQRFSKTTAETHRIVPTDSSIGLNDQTLLIQQWSRPSVKRFYGSNN